MTGLVLVTIRIRSSGAFVAFWRVDLRVGSRWVRRRREHALHGDRAFQDRDAKAVYRRFRDKGRMTPEGLTYVGSWIEANWTDAFSSWSVTTPACCSSG